jgi:NAD-dependent dihydropyrimidine dehydrogenase PreA subunit
MDVLAESLEPRSPPAVAYPEECWFCGCCAAACPVGAVRVVIPLPMRVSVWKGAER